MTASEPERHLSTPPGEAALAWVEASLGAPVVEVEALPGGISSSVHRLRLAPGPSGPDRAVLRRYTLTEWLAREPNVPRDEATALRAIDRLDLGVATPRLLAVDPDGTHADVPALLMTEVAGRPVLDPADPGLWADRLADCLATIHAAPVPDGLGAFRRWDDPDGPIPTWTARPELWREAKARVAGALPTDPTAGHRPRLLHRDFHPCNVHWVDGEIVAVVDWLNACIGPVAADLAHCRRNLAMLDGPPLAERFAERYRHRTGWHAPRADLVAYDLSAVLDGPTGPFPTSAWNALGRHDLTTELVEDRIDAWLAHLLEVEPGH